MKNVTTLKVVLVITCMLAAARMQAAEQKLFSMAKMWPSEEGPNCPIERSKDIVGIGFTSRYAYYTGADTWYPSWDADGNLYTPWTDGGVGHLGGHLGGSSWSGYPKATTCHAKIVGNDPMHLKVYNLGSFRAAPLPYGGRYPCGTLCYNGIWYHGSYCLDGSKYAWWIQRPFVGFRWSADKGKTWTDTTCSPLDNIFAETPDPAFGEGERMITYEHKDRDGKMKTITEKIVAFEKVKMGAPHFVDFGKNMEFSPDGKAYIVGHGATDREGAHAWNLGDQIYMARVKPSPETINDRRAWEYFAGRDKDGKAVWSGEWKDIKPILDWPQHMGIVTCTYNPVLKRYIMFVTAADYTGEETYDVLVLESDKVDGEYRLVSYMKDFGTQAYFVNMPTKFISKDGKTAWIIYSNNCIANQHINPTGTGYNMSMVELKFFEKGDKQFPTYKAPTPFLQKSNVALKAKFSCSSYSKSLEGYKKFSTKGEGLITGYVGHNPYENWLSDNKNVGEWVRLDWNDKQKVDRIVLVGWPYRGHVVQEGTFTFSDGSTERLTMELPRDASNGVEIRFAPKEITWVRFEITKLRGMAALGEMAVFLAK